MTKILLDLIFGRSLKKYLPKNYGPDQKTLYVLQGEDAAERRLNRFIIGNSKAKNVKFYTLRKGANK